MSNSVYQINKGINQSIEFKGIKAQYIWYLGGGVVVLMILFAIMYIIGLPSIICIGLIGVLGTLLVVKIYKMSNQYGEYGLMKALAKKQIPKNIKVYSRRVFMKR
jgi:xanthosine utilization system XapX-like protein